MYFSTVPIYLDTLRPGTLYRFDTIFKARSVKFLKTVINLALQLFIIGKPYF